jgi:hypothetical protein
MATYAHSGILPYNVRRRPSWRVRVATGAISGRAGGAAAELYGEFPLRPTSEESARGLQGLLPGYTA